MVSVILIFLSRTETESSQYSTCGFLDIFSLPTFNLRSHSHRLFSKRAANLLLESNTNKLGGGEQNAGACNFICLHNNRRTVSGLCVTVCASGCFGGRCKKVRVATTQPAACAEELHSGECLMVWQNDANNTHTHTMRRNFPVWLGAVWGAAIKVRTLGQKFMWKYANM